MSFHSSSTGEPDSSHDESMRSFLNEWHDTGMANKMEMTEKYDPVKEFEGTRTDQMLAQSELVPIEVLQQMREFDRRPGAPHAISSPERYEALKSHIAQHGVMSPVWVDWNPDTNEAYVSEGNHRLAAAQDLGMTHLPTVIYQSRGKSRGHSLQAPNPARADQYGYIPSYLKPSDLGFESEPWEGDRPHKMAALDWQPENPTWRYPRGRAPWNWMHKTTIQNHNNHHFEDDEHWHEGHLKDERDVNRYLDYENPMDFLRSHLQQLAAEHGVNYWGIHGTMRPPGETSDGVAHTEDHGLTTGPINTRADYLMGLHELGHLVGGREEMHDKHMGPFKDNLHLDIDDPKFGEPEGRRPLDYDQAYAPADAKFDAQQGKWHHEDPETGAIAPFDPKRPGPWRGISPYEGYNPDTEESEDRSEISPYNFEENRLETEARAWEWAFQHSKVQPSAPIVHRAFGALTSYAHPWDIRHHSPTMMSLYEQHHGFGGPEGKYPLDEKEYGPGAMGVTDPWTEWSSPVPKPGQQPAGEFDKHNWQQLQLQKSKDRADDHDFYYQLEPQSPAGPNGQRIEQHERTFVNPMDGNTYEFPEGHPFLDWYQSGYKGEPTWPKTAKESPNQRAQRMDQWNTKYPNKNEVVHDFGNGWSVQRPTTHGDVYRTGWQMLNCWRNEGSRPQVKLDDANHRILVDPNGEPRAAFFHKHIPPHNYDYLLDSMGKRRIPAGHEYIDQVIGERNKKVTPEIHEMVKQYAAARPNPVTFGYVATEDPPEELRGGLGEGVPAGRMAATGADMAGAMVAIYPPPEIAQKIAVENGEPPEQLHITLAYFQAKAADLDPQQWDEVGEIVSQVAGKHGPLDIKIGGMARFDAPDKDVEPVVGTVDSPGLAELHVELKDALGKAGYPLNEDHGFNPHLTFTYLPSGEADPEVETPVEWTSNQVVLVVGGSKQPYNLGAGSMALVASKGSRSRADALDRFLKGMSQGASTILHTASYDDSVRAVQSVLTPDLLHKEYRDSPQAHCYAASEALYHMLGGHGAGFTPMHIRHEGASHWFLRGPDGEIIDPTHGQFEQPVPYEQARGKGFLTAAPSKRASEIMRRITEKTAWYDSDENYGTRIPVAVIPGQGYVLGEPGQDHPDVERQLFESGFNRGDWIQGQVNHGKSLGIGEYGPELRMQQSIPDDVHQRILAEAAEKLRNYDYRTSGWRVVADYNEEEHPRAESGKWIVKHDQHEVKVHDHKGKHKGTVKRCRHCGTLYEKPANHQGRMGCPTCGLDPERHLRATKVAFGPNDPVHAVAQSLGWTPARTTTNGHTMYGWADELGNQHLVTAGHHHIPERQARYARTQMTACMSGACAHPKQNIGAQMVDEPGAPVIRAGQEVQYGGAHWWVMDIDGELAHIYDERGEEDIVPVQQLRAAGWYSATDNCIYCNTPLVKSPNHPTWKVCPNCEPQMVPRPAIDMRGAPSRPGPRTAADDDLAERVHEFNEGDHPDTDPDYDFVYYMGKLEMQEHPSSYRVMADNLLKQYGYDVLNFDNKLDSGVDPEWVAGSVWNGREVQFAIKQLTHPELVEEAEEAVRKVLRG